MNETVGSGGTNRSSKTIEDNETSHATHDKDGTSKRADETETSHASHDEDVSASPNKSPRYDIF